MSVVSGVTVESGLGDPPVVTELEYQDGTWDPVERTFAGFGGATQSDVGDDSTPTLVTETTFDTGLDVRALRGQPRFIEQRDEKGHVFTRTTNEYAKVDVDTSVDGRPIRYGYRSSELVEHVEGVATPRSVLTQWTQDEYGNVIEEDKWGEVVGDNILAGNDEAVVLRTFAVNAADWLLDRVASEELQDGQGKRVALKRTYYDGAAFKGLSLGQVDRGDVTRIVFLNALFVPLRRARPSRRDGATGRQRRSADAVVRVPPRLATVVRARRATRTERRKRHHHDDFVLRWTQPRTRRRQGGQRTGHVRRRKTRGVRCSR